MVQRKLLCYVFILLIPTPVHLEFPRRNVLEAWCREIDPTNYTRRKKKTEGLPFHVTPPNKAPPTGLTSFRSNQHGSAGRPSGLFKGGGARAAPARTRALTFTKINHLDSKPGLDGEVAEQQVPAHVLLQLDRHARPVLQPEARDGSVGGRLRGR